jgi:glycosyltransferase involved in cell wall biosynthesis
VVDGADGAIAVGEGRLSTFALAGEIARAFGVDVIHSIQSLSTLTGPRCVALKQAGRSRLVLHVTGIGPHLFGRGSWGAADRVVVGSPYLRRFFPTADIVYPMPGVRDVSPLEAPTPGSAPTIGFLGAFERERGVETLLAACGILRARGLRFRLRVAWNGVGGESGRQRVLRAAQASDIEIDIEGTVDLREFYRDVHVVVIPRVSQMRMSLPLRIVECALLQRPIVVSRILGMDQVVGDIGGSFSAGVPESLADTLAPLLTQPDRWEACRVAAARRRDEFLPEVSLERLEHIYASINS